MIPIFYSALYFILPTTLFKTCFPRDVRTRTANMVCAQCRADAATLVCSACGQIRYCSKECQKKSWREYGHKEYCRKDDEFKKGDFVRLNGLKSKPELNDLVVQVMGPVPNADDRWEVKSDPGSKSLSIAGKNCKHLRPFDCLRKTVSNVD